MSLRMGLRPLTVCSALFVFSQLAAAQAKIAVVDLRRAVFECAEIKKADAEMPAKFKVGLVAFSTSARLVVSPTEDHQKVKNAIANLRPEAGTALGDAIALAVQAAVEADASQKPSATPAPGTPAIPDG